MTAPRRPGEQATIRGLIVVFVAVLVGVALLSRSDGGIFGSAEAGSAGPTTTTTSTTASSTTPSSKVPTSADPAGEGAQPHDPAEVKVIVVNAAGGIVGIGQSNTDQIAAAGFQVLDVKNAEQAVDATGLFFRQGFEADATAVKQALGFGEVPIQPAPDPPLIPEAAEANVVVVLGQDYEAAAGG
jgi:hypothetical protein